MGRPDMIPIQTIDKQSRVRICARKEIDRLLVPPDKASTLLTDHLITHYWLNAQV